MVMPKIVLLLILFTTRDVRADGNHVHRGFCPPQITDHSDANSSNASGLFADDVPENLTPQRRCICSDFKPCLALCPLRTKNDTGMFYVVDNYANYAAIPRILTTDGTIDVIATSVGPEEWFDIFVWRPCPQDLMYPLTPEEYETDVSYLLGNGSLFFPNVQTTLGSKLYCLRLGPDEVNYSPWICSPESEMSVVSTDVDKAKYIGCLVAVPFIIVTVIVYSVLPELRNIHGKTLRCYLCCLAVSNVALAVDRLPDAEFKANTWCLCLGFFIYFSSIAYFAWLNVMCFDLWRRLGHFGSLGTSGCRNDRKKFFWYSVYVWGVSVVMTATCIGMEFSPDIPDSLIRPGFDETACWFSEAAVSYYFFGPTGLSIVFNICLFVSISIKLIHHEKSVHNDFDNRDSGRHNRNKQWFSLHVKLFIVMGICWSTEIISSFWKGPEYFWLIPNIVNTLQGVLIFLLFVCKKSVWLSLKKRYGKKKSRGIDSHRFDRVRTAPNTEDPLGVRDTSSQIFSDRSLVTREETLTNSSAV